MSKFSFVGIWFPPAWQTCFRTPHQCVLVDVDFWAVSYTLGGNAPRIRGFWNRIFCLLLKVTGLSLKKMHKVALLNRKSVGCSKPIQKLIHFILLGAKLTVAWAYKQPTVSFAAAKHKVSWIMIQEKSASLLLDTSDKFEAVLESWKTYIQPSPCWIVINIAWCLILLFLLLSLFLLTLVSPYSVPFCYGLINISVSFYFFYTV